MKNIILISLLSASVMGACNKKLTHATPVEEKQNTNQVKQTKPYQQLYYSNYAGNEKASQEIINNELGFSMLWDEITSKSSPSPEKPSIDFSKHSVIAIHFGQVNHGVNKKELKTIRPSEKEYEIVLVSEPFDLNRPHTMEISNPVMLILTDKIENNPTIKLTYESK